MGKHGPKGDEPDPKNKKYDDFEAGMVGLSNKYEIQALRNYLWANGKFQVDPVSYHAYDDARFLLTML